MSDLAALANKLAFLIDENVQFSDGARVISQGGAPAPLPAVLNEIDNTVLERTLVFRMDDTEVRMSVAGRRLRGISGVSENAANAEALLGTPLTHEDEATLAQTGKFLLDLCAQAGRVTVRTEPAEPFGSSADVGLPASGLAEAWAINMDEKPAPAMERFLAANAAEFSAWVFIEAGEILEQAGKSNELKSIWADQVPELRKKHKALTDSADSPSLICMDKALRGDEAVAVAIAGEEAFVFSCASPKVGPILQSWYAITG